MSTINVTAIEEFSKIPDLIGLNLFVRNTKLKNLLQNIK